MDKQTLQGLEQLNQLRLTDEQAQWVLGFFAEREQQAQALDAVDTNDVERMVHVMPMINVLRDDVVTKDYTRDELQEGAPEVMDGYWQVPRVAV